MPLVTYEQTRPWASAMAHAVEMKMMPPWFADPRYGHFANDASLTDQQIATIAAWATAEAPPRRSPRRPTHRASGHKAGTFRSQISWSRCPRPCPYQRRDKLNTPTKLCRRTLPKIAGYRCQNFVPEVPPMFTMRWCTSVRRIAVAAARSRRPALYGFDAERPGGATPGPRNHQRPAACLRAGQFAGSVAGRHG